MGKNEKFIANALELPECIGDLSGVHDALYAMGGKWKLPIVISLYDGGKRFNEIQRCVLGISAKILSNELKELELNGFIKRHVDTSYPVVISYHLTPYSFTLKDLIQVMSQWGLQHRKMVKSGELEKQETLIP